MNLHCPQCHNVVCGRTKVQTKAGQQHVVKGFHLYFQRFSKKPNKALQIQTKVQIQKTYKIGSAGTWKNSAQIRGLRTGYDEHKEPATNNDKKPTNILRDNKGQVIRENREQV
ncbi:hypothetical protein ILYODFUR_032282 [Ilyodon furcidens]|uniref:Uncharacterized protein n=1 Tax=Ilyodon furcidens TaxID=33524 RepID=A0ABV0U2A6_9TELE